MIRINLLAGERQTTQKKPRSVGAPSAPGAVRRYLWLELFVVVAIVLCVSGWLYKSARIAELDDEIAAAVQRQAELQVIAQEVARYEAQKALLEQKLQTIRDLKAQQGTAVRLIDEISQALPDFVWLNSLDQIGPGLTFRGSSSSLSAVANFIQNLQERTHPLGADGQPQVCQPRQRQGCWFPQVDLSGSQEANDVVTFTLAASFQPPPDQPEDVDAVAAAAAAGGAQ